MVSVIVPKNMTDVHFAQQEITLGKTPYLMELEYGTVYIPDEFYEKGFTLVSHLSSAKQAQYYLEKFIANIDPNKVPLYRKFKHRIQLAKRDQIPICDDSVETSFQALHFDMGQPFSGTESQNMYLVTGLYIPQKSAPKTAKTRVVSLKGLFHSFPLTNHDIEHKILEYVEKYGDGWFYPDQVNTNRISCFARIIDAVSGTTDLADYIDKTMAQWFQDPKKKDGYYTMQKETDFYKERGIDLDVLEEDITIAPGELLIIDNMRTAHGRIGKREAKETWQFMYGVHNADAQDIEFFRKEFVKLLKS